MLPRGIAADGHPDAIRRPLDGRSLRSEGHEPATGIPLRSARRLLFGKYPGAREIDLHFPRDEPVLRPGMT